MLCNALLYTMRVPKYVYTGRYRVVPRYKRRKGGRNNPRDGDGISSCWNGDLDNRSIWVPMFLGGGTRTKVAARQLVRAVSQTLSLFAHVVDSAEPLRDYYHQCLQACSTIKLQAFRVR